MPKYIYVTCYDSNYDWHTADSDEDLKAKLIDQFMYCRGTDDDDERPTEEMSLEELITFCEIGGCDENLCVVIAGAEITGK